MEKEKIQNLTPKMVEELKTLGVEFGETQDVWIECCRIEYEKEEGEEIESLNRGEWVKCNYETYEYLYENADYDLINTRPCPNLQEVLDKLPKDILSKEETFKNGREPFLENVYLHIFYSFKEECIIGYHTLNFKEYFNFKDYNPLLASFELLKWVATNHPESLTDKK